MNQVLRKPEGAAGRRLLGSFIAIGLLGAPAALLWGGCSAPGDSTESQVGEAQQRLTQCVTLQRGTGGNVQDAMLSDPPTGQNYGSGPILRVGGKDESLLQFDLSSIPSYAIVDSATLKLYVNGSAGDTPIQIHRAKDAWSENTVTFASFAQHYDAPVSGVLLPASKNAFKSADITSLVASWVNGSHPNHGVLLETDGKKKTIFVSSDAGSAAQRPSLEVCYQVPDDHCTPNPCDNGGTCNNDWDGYTCSCTAGWTGPTCAVSMHECSTDPCQNGGVCTNLPDDYSCACPPGYDGKSCETLIDNCAPNPCQNAGICTSGVNTYTCSCPPGFTGANCEIDIDDCASQPCVNGDCSDEVNGYACTCLPGWTGTNCDVDIDDCADNQCENGATCVDGLASYTCACLPGWGGAYCQDNLNECATEPCLNGATCVNGVNSYTCQCAAGYTGTNCDVDIDECASQPCQNGGLCVDGVGTYTCQCAAGWLGASCDVPMSGAPTVIEVTPGAATDQVLSSPAIEVVVPAGVQVQVNGVPTADPISLSAQIDGSPAETFDVPLAVEEEMDEATGEIEPGTRHVISPVYRFGPPGATFDPPLQATLVVPSGMTEPEMWLCDDDGANCERRSGIFFEDTSVSPPQSKLYIEIDHFSTVVITNRNPIGINYGTGPVMKGTPTVYYIWYKAPSASTPSILADLVTGLNDSPYMAINTGYSDPNGNVSGKLAYGGAVTYSGSLTSLSLTQADVRQIVQDTLTAAKLPTSTNAIYLVITAPTVSVDGFCTKYCGWHNYYLQAGQPIKYSFVGDASTKCPSGCMGQSAKSPNSNPGADAMASIIAHEIVETLTDPALGAWRDSSGNENADKCNFNFGPVSTAANGSYYNVTLGSRKFLIQQNWDPVKGVCAMSAPVFQGSPNPDGTPCDDGNACTQTDQYQNGVCVGFNPKSCTASDQCHLAGACNASTGLCSNPAKSDGAACNDGNACTADTCQSGTCTGKTPTTCIATRNLALSGTASQSSTLSNSYNPIASKAIDGNTNGDFTGASVTHTNSEAQAWWQVDLGAVKNIASVKLYNRTDCCADRLSNFDVLISTDGNWASPSTFKSYVPGQAPPQLSVPAGVAGRYVRVQLRGTNPLSLAEVQVFGCDSACDDNNTCTTDSCAPATGCTYSTLADGAACDDGNVSTPASFCGAGACTTQAFFSAQPEVLGNDGVCTTYGTFTQTIVRTSATQPVYLASNAAGTAGVTYDELGTLVVTSPTSTVKKANIISWEADCKDPTAPDISTGAGPVDITSLFGSEIGTFTLTMSLRSKYGVYSWTPTYVKLGQ